MQYVLLSVCGNTLKQFIICCMTQFGKQWKVWWYELILLTLLDECVDFLSISSIGEAPPGTRSIGQLCDDNRMIDSL